MPCKFSKLLDFFLIFKNSVKQISVNFQVKQKKMTSLNKEIIRELRERLREWAVKSTFHAIPSIVQNEKSIIKIIWVLFLLISSSYCGYGIVKSFQDYFKYEVNTLISTERVDSLEFPTITICNKNPFRIEPGSFVLMDKFKYIINHYFSVDFFDYNDPLTILTFLEYVTQSIKHNSNLTLEEKIKIGFNIEDMLVNCRYNNLECSYKAFHLFYSETHGNCYKFNSGLANDGTPMRIVSTSSPGRTMALKLELFLGYPSEDLDVISSTGAYIFVHDHSSNPLLDSEGLSVSTGEETDIVIRKFVINRQSKPYSDCIVDIESKDSFNSGIYQTTVLMNQKYSQKVCLMLCYQRYLIQKCGCYDSKIVNFQQNVKPCDDTAILLCAYHENVKFYNSSYNKNCFYECPQECDSVEYALSSSHSDFPSPFYANILIKKFNKSSSQFRRNFTRYENIKKSVAKINIYFSDISYTTISEVPSKLIEQLIGDLGGILGICVGASLLSFIELIEIILELIFVYGRMKKKQLTETNDIPMPPSPVKDKAQNLMEVQNVA